MFSYSTVYLLLQLIVYFSAVCLLHHLITFSAPGHDGAAAAQTEAVQAEQARPGGHLDPEAAGGPEDDLCLFEAAALWRGGRGVQLCGVHADALLPADPGLARTAGRRYNIKENALGHFSGQFFVHIRAGNMYTG